MVFVYAGTILPGHWLDRTLDITSVFEAVGAHAHGDIDDTTLHEIEAHACPTEGSCAGMFTANTMASVAEALGMALPAGATPPAVDPRPRRHRLRIGSGCREDAGKGHPAPPDHDKAGLRERDRRDDGARGLDERRAAPAGDRQRGACSPSRSTTSTGWGRVPHLADMKPHGKFHMVDLDRVGGVPTVMRMLAEEGLINVDCLTVTGRSVGENLERLGPPAPDGTVVHDFGSPIHSRGIVVLRGSLAPKGAVVKIAGADIDCSRARHGSSTARRRRWRRSLPARSRPAPSSSSATRARREGPGCGRCSRSPARSSAGRRVSRLRARHGRPLLRRDPGVLHRPRRPRGVRRRPDRASSPTETAVAIDAGAGSIDLDLPATELSRAPRGVERAPGALFGRRAREVPPRLVSGAERGAVTEP